MCCVCVCVFFFYKRTGKSVLFSVVLAIYAPSDQDMDSQVSHDTNVLFCNIVFYRNYDQH